MARTLLDAGTFEVREAELPMEIQPDPDAVYVLRPFGVSDARRLGKKHTRYEFDPRTHRKAEVVDQEGLNDDIMDHIIAGWRGVGAGEGAPCTLENKLKLPVPVQRALIERAQVGRSAEVRAESFREPSPVGAVPA